jgi:hypothetical protein
MNLVREPDAGNLHVRFDERGVETEHGMRLLRHKRGNPDPEYVEAYPTAPPLDSDMVGPVKGCDSDLVSTHRVDSSERGEVLGGLDGDGGSA